MAVEQARGQERRQRILDAAVRVFSRHGYRDAAVEEIADESGTSKGGIYFHFPNKQAIFVALLDRMAALLLDRMESSAAGLRDPAERLDAALRTVLSTFASHRTLARLFLVEAMGAGREFDARMVEVQYRFAGVIQRHLNDAVAQGAIPALDTEVTSVAWFGAVNQVVTRWIVAGTPAHLDDAYPSLRALLMRSVGLPAGVVSPLAAVATEALPSAPEIATLRSTLERGARDLPPDQAVLVSSAQRIPWLDPLRLFDAADGVLFDRAYWHDPSGSLVLAGAGAAWVAEAKGSDRFRETGDAWTALLAGARLAAPASVAGAGPLLLGGFGFDPLPAHASPTGATVEPPRNQIPWGTSTEPRLSWRGFPAGRFVLPRLQVAATRDEAWLTVNVVLQPGADAAAEINRVLLLWEQLTTAPPRQVPIDAAPARLELVDAIPAERWQQTVAKAIAEIAAGRLEKVVLARDVYARAARRLDAGRALRQLRDDQRSSGFLFAVCSGARMFLGASPERLVKLRDSVVQADALAGSIARGQTAAEDWELGQSLLASTKDQAEHAVVVRVLCDSLAAAGVHVLTPAQPGLRKLGHLQHLATPLIGHLQTGSIFDIVAHLHPTPAVGGAPREAALHFLRTHEGWDRGWYAAPVGWVDRHGEGEFAVAIRSAMVDGKDAWLFAGCGIVADSDPAAEYAESCWKLRPMTSALGEA